MGNKMQQAAMAMQRAIKTETPLGGDWLALAESLTDRELKLAIRESYVKHLCWSSKIRTVGVERRRASLYDVWDRSRKGVRVVAPPLRVFRAITTDFYRATSQLPPEASTRIRHIYEFGDGVNPELLAEMAGRVAVSVEADRQGMVPIGDVRIWDLRATVESDKFPNWWLSRSRVREADLESEVELRVDVEAAYLASMPLGGDIVLESEVAHEVLATAIDRRDEEVVRTAVDLKHAIEGRVYGSVPNDVDLKYPPLFVAGKPGEYRLDLEHLMARQDTSATDDLLQQVEGLEGLDPRQQLEAAFKAWTQVRNDSLAFFPVAFLRSDRVNRSRLFFEVGELELQRLSCWGGEFAPDTSRGTVQVL
jgi:uncharacterized protein YndB with AHSA1/START domain